MTDKVIVVLGITGAQGGSVANAFLNLPGWSVRGITRDASKSSSTSWSQKGVSMVQADLNDPSTLTTAFKDACVIFSTTNFYDAFYNPTTQSLLAPGQSINEYCYEQELRQGRNIVDAAAKVEGLERFVVASLVDAEKWSGGKYKGVYHFDSKARVVEYTQEKHSILAAKMSTVLVGNYMENWKGLIKLQRGPDGAYRLALPGSGLGPLPQIDVGSDLGTIVHAAVQAEPGKNILGASRMISWTKMLELWCESNKVPFGGFIPVPVDVFARFIPVPGLGMEIGEMMAFMDEYGYDGGDPSVVLPENLGVPCSLTSWEEFLKKQDWSVILEG